MSQYSCPTVAIKIEPCDGNPAGVVVINEEDFDPATMTMCEQPDTPAVETPAEDAAKAVVETPAKVVAPWAAK